MGDLNKPSYQGLEDRDKDLRLEDKSKEKEKDPGG